MPVDYQDYYQELGVPRDAPEDDIRQAYRKLARTFHPDVSKDPDADDRFKRISEAYEVLRDPEKRKAYDRFGADWKAGQDVSGADGFGAGFGGARYGDYGPGGGVHVDFGDGGADFSDFFSSMFGAGGARYDERRQAPRRGADQESSIELSLEDALAGGTRHLALSDGRSYDVSIPRGVRDGQRIRLAGEGGVGRAGGPSGDLFLRVRLAPHPRFAVDGDDLEVQLPISPAQAALGTQIPLQTLDGTLKIRVPAGSSSGRRLRLAGEGLPTRSGGRGDLYARIQLVVPSRLTDRQRELYEQLAAADEES